MEKLIAELDETICTLCKRLRNGGIYDGKTIEFTSAITSLMAERNSALDRRDKFEGWKRLIGTYSTDSGEKESDNTEQSTPAAEFRTYDNAYMNVGENLKNRRTLKRMSQTELAEKAGCGQGMIAHIERGVKIPSLALAYEIAKALDCTIDDLCREEGV